MNASNRRLKIILNFVIRLFSALGIISLGVLIMLQSNQLGEGTTATLITLIVGALGVSIGFTAINKNDESKNKPEVK